MKKLFGGGKRAVEKNTLVNKVVMVGAYSVRVEALVGEGGFATIYRCVDMKSGHTFALKHMRLAADTDAIKEVQQEAKTMARLKGHPNVLKLHAVAFAGPPGGETDGFMLLDYCPVTLLEVMQRSAFSLDDFLVYEVFQDVVMAVAHMHSCKPPLAHRDLKAENVLKNSEGRWVICDFGSSTARAQVYETPAEIAVEEENIRRTTTPAYRAPEMWDLYSRQRIDQAVDVWALGVLLYVLAFGKLPFQGDSKLSILYGKYDMPSGRPPAMRQLITDMLQVNPADRPDVFQVLSRLDVLRVVLSSEALPHTGGEPYVPPQLPPPLPPPLPQPAPPVGTMAPVAAAAAAAAAAGAVASHAIAHAPQQHAPPPGAVAAAAARGPLTHHSPSPPGWQGQGPPTPPGAPGAGPQSYPYPQRQGSAPAPGPAGAAPIPHPAAGAPQPHYTPPATAGGQQGWAHAQPPGSGMAPPGAGPPRQGPPQGPLTQGVQRHTPRAPAPSPPWPPQAPPQQHPHPHPQQQQQQAPPPNHIQPPNLLDEAVPEQLPPPQQQPQQPQHAPHLQATVSVGFGDDVVDWGAAQGQASPGAAATRAAAAQHAWDDPPAWPAAPPARPPAPAPTQPQAADEPQLLSMESLPPPTPYPSVPAPSAPALQPHPVSASATHAHVPPPVSQQQQLLQQQAPPRPHSADAPQPPPAPPHAQARRLVDGAAAATAAASVSAPHAPVAAYDSHHDLIAHPQPSAVPGATAAGMQPTVAAPAATTAGAVAGGGNAAGHEGLIADAGGPRAALLRLAASNAQLEGRVRQLEAVVASQGALLQKLAAELQAVQLHQQEQQQLQQQQQQQVQQVPQQMPPRPPSLGRAVSGGAPFAGASGGGGGGGGAPHAAAAAAPAFGALDGGGVDGGPPVLRSGGSGRYGSNGGMSTGAHGVTAELSGGSAARPDSTSWAEASNNGAVYPPIRYEDLA